MTELMPSKQEPFSDLLAIIVLYQCTAQDSITLKSINSACKTANTILDLIIYDNSPTPGNPSPKFSNLNIVKYLSNPENPGVSTAYNYALHYSLEIKKPWLLLLDQDTHFPTHFVKELSGSIAKYQDIKLFAAGLKNSAGNFLSPCQQGYHWKFPISKISQGKHSLQKHSLLNSGLCIAVDTLSEVGGFNPNLPLDFSDSFLIDKLRSKNYSFYLLEAECRHHLSNEELDIERVKSRYQSYHQSSRIYAETIGNPFLFSFFLFLRAVKLSVNYKSLFFIKTFFTKSGV